MDFISRRVVGLAGAVSLLAGSLTAIARPGDFQFHREQVLGTSFDLWVRAESDTQAGQVERAILDEVERLRRILDARDGQSELFRLNHSQGPIRCSPELISVLEGYDTWNRASEGAYNGQLGGLIALWKTAERENRLPEPGALAHRALSLGKAGWKIDPQSGTVVRLSPEPIHLDSMGKGYIIEASVRKAATAAGQAVSGILLNIGGDIRVWGNGPASDGKWLLGVADPFSHFDNAVPLTRLSLGDRAVSTSAGYERGYTIQGRRYSHILDPRTGYPATEVASATVVARDNATANALATTLCVLKPQQGLKLVRETPGTECLIVAADGAQFRSGGFAALENQPAVPAAAGSKKPPLWPKENQVTISLTLKTPPLPFFAIKRPYVAIWVEDAQGKPIRTVVFWGRKPKYFRDLPGWWRFAKDQPALVQSVTRATRPAGKYEVVWDGYDDQGNPVPPGNYTVVLEVAREHGTHAQKSAAIECGKSPAKAVIPEGTEFEQAPVVYGPAPQPAPAAPTPAPSK